jgi:pimeloyl-ACP methyl ester carboxylesterase
MSLGFDRTGTGPAMLLLHPLGANRRVWDRVVPLLAPHREVWVVDLPGFGDSPPLRGDADPPALAHAVGSFLEAHSLRAPHVVGNSLGGWVALELGLAGRARAVTAIAPAGLWPQPLQPKPTLARWLARAGRPLIGAATATAAGRRRLLSGTVAHPERVPARDAAVLVRSYATAPGFRSVNAAMRAGVFTALNEIRVPVTLVWPEHDRLIVRPRQIPDAVKNVDLADAGHIPQLEVPGAVAELLLAATDPAMPAASTTAPRTAPPPATR